MVVMLYGAHYSEGKKVDAARFYTSFSICIYIVEMVGGQPNAHTYTHTHTREREREREREPINTKTCQQITSRRIGCKLLH